MEIIEYKIKKGDTLESIAREHHVSIDELVNFHNKRCSITQQIIGNYLPFHLEYFILSIDSIKNSVVEKIEKGNNILNQKIRYRCEQNNLILIDGKPSFSAQTKTQYLLSNKKDLGYSLLNVVLEDYVTSIQPQNMESAFELIKQIELIRDNITFKHSKGKIEKIININELHNKWDKFIKETSKTIPFYNDLQNKSPEVINDFIENGRKEFSDENIFCEVISKNLFYHLLINVYNDDKNMEYSFNQMSQIFPEIPLKINVLRSIVSDNENSQTFRIVGNLDINSVNLNSIRNLYEKLYQPIIKFSFTEFDFVYRITYEIEKETNILINASVSIKESVKNNYDVITKYELRKVEL